MSQDPPPPPYNTSELVRTGISAAFSTFNNPRGLEVLWNAPYGQTFHELVSSYPEGQFALYSPYRLWQPKIVKEEEILRKKFNDYALDYDDPPEGPDDKAIALEVLILENTSRRMAAANESDSKRKSKRTPNIAKNKKRTNLEATKGTIKDLLKQRVALIERQVAIAEMRHKAEQQGDTSIASFHDSGSFNLEPDMFIGHIATTPLQPPEEGEGQYRYDLRAGRKTYHQCGVAIIELKPGPKRAASDEDYPSLASGLIEEAQKNLLDYCSAYFDSYPGAKVVVAIAAAGPLWNWAPIKRADAPVWDHVFDETSKGPENSKLVKAWKRKFKSKFLLGTPNSDAQLTLIKKTYFSSFLTKDHTPDVPVPRTLDEEEAEAEAEEEV